MTCSVLMSVYEKDQPEYLESALYSIYEGQSRKPDQIVVVLDGPLTDGLYRVLAQFARGKEDVVQYCPLAQNCGLGAALKIGAEACTGDYIFRMDADDISQTSRFEIQLAYLARHPEIDVLGGDIAEFCRVPQGKLRLRRCPREHCDIAAMGKRRNPMNHVSVCIRREALMRCGGYEPLPLAEDYYLWLRMLAAGCQFANLHETLVYVRTEKTFAKKRGAKARIFSWRVLQAFMLRHRMIRLWAAAWNMVCVTGFVCAPKAVRAWLYQHILRV